MGYIIIDRIKNNNKKLMIFVEGTILKPKYNNKLSRLHILGYVPIGNSVEILRKWQEEGYEIIYLTSLKGRKAMNMARHLDELGFEGSMVGYREKYQNYATLIKEENPDVLIENSISSEEHHMCYDELTQELKDKIKHVVVNEFEGIDNIKLYEDRNIILEDISDNSKTSKQNKTTTNNIKKKGRKSKNNKKKKQEKEKNTKRESKE